MATTEEIRDALKGGPLKPSEIADQLGLTDQAERTALYGAVNQLVAKERGVERLDDGTVTLIPGWKPTRGSASTAKPARKARAAPERPTKATRKARGAKHARKQARRPRTAAEDQPERPALDEAAVQTAIHNRACTLPAATVRRLLAHIFGSERPLDAFTRQAVVEAAKEAA
jgi:hypothetical protein